MILLITPSARGQECADSLNAATGRQTHRARQTEGAGQDGQPGRRPGRADHVVPGAAQTLEHRRVLAVLTLLRAS